MGLPLITSVADNQKQIAESLLMLVFLYAWEHFQTSIRKLISISSRLYCQNAAIIRAMAEKADTVDLTATVHCDLLKKWYAHESIDSVFQQKRTSCL